MGSLRRVLVGITMFAVAASACSSSTADPVVDLARGPVAPEPAPTAVATTAPIVFPSPTPFPAFVLNPAEPYEFRAIPSSSMGAARHQIVIEQGGQIQTALESDCHTVHSVEDYDRDGLNEALIAHATGCGGNCCATRYRFIDVASDGSFTATEESIGDWNGPDIVETDEGWRLTVVDPHAGFNTTLSLTTQTFTLVDGRFVEVARVEAVELPAVAEIRSALEQDTRLVFDLNDDGIDEAIACAYWARWGSFTRCVLRIEGQPDIPLEMGGKRIGVLDTTTNGWHDLIADFDTVYVWHDGEYLTDD